MEIAIILLVVCCVLVWVVIYARSYVCPECNKRIRRNNICVHLEKCVSIWYSLPIVPVSHISALEVRGVDSKMWGIWDAVAEDWVRDFNQQTDERVLKINANKLLKLIKAKSRFNKLVNGETNARPKRLLDER